MHSWNHHGALICNYVHKAYTNTTDVWLTSKFCYKAFLTYNYSFFTMCTGDPALLIKWVILLKSTFTMHATDASQSESHGAKPLKQLQQTPFEDNARPCKLTILHFIHSSEHC